MKENVTITPGKNERPSRRGCRLLCALLLCCLSALSVRAQQVAVKTNVLMDAVMMPNLGCEFVVGERSTLDLSLFGATNVYGHSFQLVGFQPEYRYWFNGRPMTREFFGLALLGATYDITWGNHYYAGDAVGAGVTLGYDLNLGKRLNIEFYGGFGAVYFRQRQYYVTDSYEDYHVDPTIRVNSTGYKLLPIKIGVAVSYIIK